MDKEDKKGHFEMNRRTFLISSALATGSIVTGAVNIARAGLASTPRSSEGVVWPDPELCIGCLMCEGVCSDWHTSQGLSSIPRIRVFRTEKGKVNPAVVRFAGGIRFEQSPCKQCSEPNCYAVCPSGALKIDSKTGARYIDEQICIACGKCREACPYDKNGILQSVTGNEKLKRIFFDSQKKVYTKCDLCRGRKGGPACVEHCPINGEIKAGRIKSDHLCLEVKASTRKAMDEIL